nr:Spx/MgsR family RNA polymerase-binding regulatory protein [uncultured Cohaesibacter sp.]
MKLFGIKSCDTCRKALNFLETAGTPVTFVDLRGDGFASRDLDRWLAAADWEDFLNRRSTSWRALSEEDKRDIDTDKARALMLANPTLIKRPVIEDGDRLIIGFGKQQQDDLLKG